MSNKLHPIPDTWNAFFRGKFHITEKFTNDFSVIWNFPLKNAFHVSGIGCTKLHDPVTEFEYKSN